MNTTNADHFTFNVDNTMFLTGQTGCGKSVLQDKLIERYVEAHAPDALQFVLLDMTSVDFGDLRENHKEYIMTDISIDSQAGLAVLEELAILSDERIAKIVKQPMIFICIEECDMAYEQPPRFVNALLKINANAKQANMKLIYSTSRPGTIEMTPKLLESFDLILCGTLASVEDEKYLGIEGGTSTKPFEFLVK